MDDLTQDQRLLNMSHIRAVENKPETLVRKYLFSQGFRYRKNVSDLPGKPDIVLPKYHTVIFINGCFWHQHPGCRYAVLPKTRQDYWIPKLQKNVERDRINREKLESVGWRVIVIWECELKTKEKRASKLGKLKDDILTNAKNAAKA